MAGDVSRPCSAEPGKLASPPWRPNVGRRAAGEKEGSMLDRGALAWGLASFLLALAIFRWQ
jgi:hypothetical protein